MKKIISIDMDGTLLDDNSKLCLENIETINKIKNNNNFIIVIATGRNLKATMPYVKKFNENDIDYLICSNGAIVYSLSDNKIMANRNLHKNEIEDIVYLSEKLSEINTHFVSNESIFTFDNPIGRFTILDAYLSFLNINYVNKSKIMERTDLSKALITSDIHNVENIMKRIPNIYYDDFNIVKSSDKYIEILPKEVDKGNALKELSLSLGVNKENIVSIGDQQNDIGMFRVSGVSYAMKGASDDVKKEATHIGFDNNDSGVAKIIKELYRGDN